MLGDHHMIGKCRALEGSAHVPFLCRPPKSWGHPGGQAVDAPVGLQDVMPTLLDAAGVTVPNAVTGRSVLPLMREETARRGPSEDSGWRDALYGEHCRRYARHGAMHFLTDGPMKYVWYSETGEELLFDLDDDPHELHNLAPQGDNAGHLSSWRQRLVQELRDRPEGFVNSSRATS
jgi:arylsulfatase A-like enzyme